MFKVSILADSINATTNRRIVSFELEYPRFIHSELMTHRALSRNASSSRAIPVERMIAQVLGAPAMPIHWGANRPGMQAREEVSPARKADAIAIWEAAAFAAVKEVEKLVILGVHKQVANRLLEPFQVMRTVVTGTEWDHFFGLRCHPDAQPEFQHLANMMRNSMQYSIPQVLEPGQWHVPYAPQLSTEMTLREILMTSVAGCARVSYKLHDGASRTLEADRKLFDQLTTSVPMHASPLEHQACALDYGIIKMEDLAIQRNLHGGFIQLRTFLEQPYLPPVAEIYRPWPIDRLSITA